MSFDIEKVKAIVAPVADKANDVVRDLNDRFDDVSEPVKSLVTVAITSVAFIMFSTVWTTVTLVAMVAFRAYPTVADRFFPATIVTDAVVDPVVEVAPDGTDDDGITLGDNKTVSK